MSPLWTTIAALAGYLLGSLPFGYWVAKAHGVDILAVGSGNVGATNVKRSVGKGAGNLVFVLDLLKGAVAAGWVRLIPALPSEQMRLLALIGLVAALVGHSFSLFLRFRGGKGVSTTLGGLLVMMPWVTLVGVGVWLIFFYASRYVSLASLGLAASLPVSAHYFGYGWLYFGFATALAVFIFVRHRSNIVRLLNGTENRFARK